MLPVEINFSKLNRIATFDLYNEDYKVFYYRLCFYDLGNKFPLISLNFASNELRKSFIMNYVPVELCINAKRRYL
jgi:hypothetical protein